MLNLQRDLVGTNFRFYFYSTQFNERPILLSVLFEWARLGFTAGGLRCSRDFGCKRAADHLCGLRLFIKYWV